MTSKRPMEFDGLKVMLVEDESMVALMIEDMLEELGCQVAASFARLPEAVEAAPHIEVGLAVLDVNVSGQQVFPVAEILRQRHVPIIFSTGYGERALDARFKGFPALGKPYSISELRLMIGKTLQTSRQVL